MAECGLERHGRAELAGGTGDTGERGHQRLPVRREPGLGQPEDVEEGQRVTHADECAAGDGQRQPVGEREEQLAGGHEGEAGGKRAAGTDAVGGHTGGQLHEQVGRELHGDEDTERPGRDMQPRRDVIPGHTQQRPVEHRHDVHRRPGRPHGPRGLRSRLGGPVVHCLHL
jgi:hypothetical protein